MAPSRTKKKPSSPSCASIISEAQRLKQQAERKHPEGPSREPILTQCVALLEQALLSNPSAREEEEALFDLGEVYALWGNAVQSGMYERIGSILCNGNLRKGDASNIQADASERSLNMHRKSHDMYEKILLRGSSELQQESLVNSANALCDCGELCLALPVTRAGGASAAANLFALANSRYLTALSEAPNDVELLANFGDLNIKIAELSMSADSGPSRMEAWWTAKSYYDKAMAAYEHACSLADASAGDDLAGLLQNWGAGLMSLAERSLDTAEVEAAYEHALEKLRTSAKFSPTNTSVFIAIGEACCARAEKVDKAQALEILACAVEEGFGTALKISATCLDAVIGKGEAHLAAGRFAVSIQKQQVAQAHFSESLDSYMKALQILQADKRNEGKLKFEEQSDIVFNLACVAAITNQECIAADALSLLVRINGVSSLDLVEDSDLQNVRTKEWFLALIQKGIDATNAAQ